MNQFILQPATRPIESEFGEFEHSFGGQLKTPVIPQGGASPCHLLYTIDTADPLSPIQVQESRFVPLLYCQQYDAGAMGYRVTKEGVILDYFENPNAWDEDFPYDDYPNSFPKMAIKLKALTQNEIEHIDHWIDVFEMESPSEKDIIIQSESWKELERINYPFSQFGGRHLMPQTIPSVKCPNCKARKMDVFAVIWNNPEKGIFLWDTELTQWGPAQIIYQICSRCQAIHVCSRSS